MKPNAIFELTADRLKGRIHPGRAVASCLRTIFDPTPLLVALAFLPSHAPAAPPQLQIQSDTAAVHLVVAPLAQQGALFVYEAADLASLVAAPPVLLATNAPAGVPLRIDIPWKTANPSQLFSVPLNGPDARSRRCAPWRPN